TTPPPPADAQASTADGAQLLAQDAEARRRAAGPKIRRLGAELMTEPGPIEGPDYNPLVPADYLVQAGDELLVTLWASVDAGRRPIGGRQLPQHPAAPGARRGLDLRLLRLAAQR